MIQSEKAKYNINLSDEEIGNMSKCSFKRIVDQKVNYYSYSSLTQCRKSKVENIILQLSKGSNKKPYMQPYLTTNLLSTLEKQTLFSLRCRNFNVKSNYKTMYEGNMICRICQDPQSYEDEDHTFSCQVLVDGLEIGEDVKFSDIYSNTTKQINAVKSFMKIIKNKLSLAKRMALNKFC